MRAPSNPCFCGKLLDGRGCRCSSTQIQRYLSKVSGPLLDQIDLHVEVPAQPFDALTQTSTGESSATIRARVQRAIAWREQRGQHQPNARLSAKDLKGHCQLTADATKLLRTAMQELELSARSYTKLLKIARTIADLAEQPTIQPDHLAEAIQYRSLDRPVDIRMPGPLATVTLSLLVGNLGRYLCSAVFNHLFWNTPERHETSAGTMTASSSWPRIGIKSGMRSTGMSAWPMARRAATSPLSVCEHLSGPVGRRQLPFEQFCDLSEPSTSHCVARH